MRADYEKMARQAGRKPGRMLAALIAFLLILLIVAVMILRAAFSGSMGFSGGEPEEKYKVAMIVKSTKSAFFQSVFAGAGVAATEYNIELTTEGPETEEDYEMQNALIDQAVQDGADAIVISAVDFEENKAAVDRAAGKGLPVVVIGARQQAKPREHRQPPHARGQVVHGLGKQDTHGGLVGGQAEAQKGDGGFVQNSMGKKQHRSHHQLGKQVGQHMPCRQEQRPFSQLSGGEQVRRASQA